MRCSTVAGLPGVGSVPEPLRHSGRLGSRCVGVYSFGFPGSTSFTVQPLPCPHPPASIPPARWAGLNTARKMDDVSETAPVINKNKRHRKEKRTFIFECAYCPGLSCLDSMGYR